MRRGIGDKMSYWDVTQREGIIEDPLKWQTRIDASHLHLNVKGCRRFWLTVEHLLDGRLSYLDDVPHPSVIVLQLRGNVGLEIRASSPCDGPEFPVKLKYKFVKLCKEQDVETVVPISCEAGRAIL